MASPYASVPKDGIDLMTPTGSELVADLPPLPEPPGPIASGFKTGVAGVKSAAGGVLSMAGRGFGLKGLEQTGDNITAAANEDAAMYSRRAEDIKSVGDAVDFAQYGIATALPSMLAMLAGAGAGRLVGGAVARRVSEDATRRLIQNTGMAGGAVGTSMGLEAGGIYPEAVKEGVESPIARSIAGGVAAGALDVVPEFYLARKLGLLGGAGRGATSRLSNAAQTAGKSALLEGTTEGAQTGIGRFAAGQELTDNDARLEYLNSVLIGMVSGGAFGGAAGALAPTGRVQETPGNEQVAPDVLRNGENVDTTPAAVAPPTLEELQTQRQTVVAARDEIAAKIATLEASLAAPPEAREGRTKSSITKELMEARKAFEVASSPLPALDGKIADLEITALRSVERTPLTVGTEISLPQDPVVNDGPINPPSIPVDLSDPQRQAFAVQTTPFERPADKVANLQGTSLVELPDGSPQPAPTPQPLIVAPDPTFSSSRGTLKQGTTEQKKRAFIENSLQAADAQTKDLVSSGALPEAKVAKIRSSISSELEKIFDGTQDPEQVRTKLEGAIAKAVKGRINKGDAETFTEELLAKIAGQPQEFLSKGGVDRLAGTKVVDDKGQPLRVFHATASDFRTFQPGAGDLGIHFGTSTSANKRLDNTRADRGESGGERILPVYLSIKNPLRLNDAGGWNNPDEVARVVGEKVMEDEAFSEAYEKASEGKRTFKEIFEAMGYDGVVYDNVGEGGGDSYIVFRPEQIISSITLDSKTAVNQTPDQLAAQGREIYSTLQRLLGDPADLEVRLFEQNDPQGFAGRYRTGWVKDIIEIATNSKDRLSVAAHEAFHRIETKHLSAQERAILSRGLKKGTDFYNRVIEAARQYDNANGTNITSEIESVPQEARAYGFEMWRRGELEATGPIQRVFQKIQRLLEKVRNYIAGLGFTSVEDIYQAVDMGAYAKTGANTLMVMDATEAYNFVDQAYASTADTTTSAAFKKWFGDSKVVDANGKPLVVYHGTGAEFTAFDPAKSFDGGLYFTPDKDHAEEFGAMKTRGEVRNITAYLSVSNPLEIDAEGVPFDEDMQNRLMDEIHRGKMSGQFDGIVVRNLDALGYGDLSDMWVAFYPEQIKSAIGNRGTFDPSDPNILHSRAALADSLQDIANLAKSGSAEPTQIIASLAKLVEGVNLPNATAKDLLGAHTDAFKGGLTRSFLTHISSGLNLARQSNGFKNVFDVVTAYEQRKNRLIAEGVDVKLKTWQSNKTSNDNIANVSKALLARTVDGVKEGTAEYQALIAPLTEVEKTMFNEATQMIAAQLDAEFVADQRTMQNALGADSDAYAEWVENRTAQIQRLKDEGYVPERRYGDHVVYATVPFTTAQGKTFNLTVLREQFDSQAEATIRVKQYQEALGTSGDLKVQYGFKYSPEHDASLSYQQFLDMARRFNIEVSQAEKERLAKATISADSVRRNRIFRRKNVAGYSEDGLRVLSEFAVTMANKIAYSEFSGAIADAQQGRQVSVTAGPNGSPVAVVDDKVDLWTTDGPNAGFLRQRTDDMVDFVLQPQRGGEWSRTARMAASLHFLGGSMAAAVVQASALPMVSTPYLSQFTGYGDANAKVLSAFKTAVGNSALRDIEKLQNRSVQIPSVDGIAGLRDALARAAEDGTTLDTEIYQIMGQSRGSMLSKSRTARRALEAWMYPFREAEKVNRTATFIAAFRIGQQNKMVGDKLYEFARDAVYNTQNRFDEANRPALARNPIGAILFTFKATPLFLVETITMLHKQSPKAAVFMLLSLFVAAGVNGLPFAEDIMDVIDTVAQRIFKSPFNSQRAMKNVLKNASEAIAGTDLSGLFMNGVVNELTGLSFASRVGLGNLIPGTRMFAADTDYKRNAQEMLGPVASQVIGGFEAAESLTKGDWVKAIRQGGPLAAQNAVKGLEQWSQGYAQDAGGRKLVDVSGFDALLQGMGFASAAVNHAYMLDRIDKQSMAFYQMVRTDFTNSIVKAVRDGDPEQIRETVELVNDWNKTHPDMPIALNPSNIRKTIAEAGMPLSQRTLMNLPRQLRGSSEAYELTRNE